MLVVIITRNGTGAGCSIGPLTNYATIDHDEFDDREIGGLGRLLILSQKTTIKYDPVRTNQSSLI